MCLSLAFKVEVGLYFLFQHLLIYNVQYSFFEILKCIVFLCCQATLGSFGLRAATSNDNCCWPVHFKYVDNNQ